MDAAHAGLCRPKVGRGRGIPRSGRPAFVDDRAPPIKTDELVDFASPPRGEVGRLAKRARRVGRIGSPGAWGESFWGTGLKSRRDSARAAVAHDHVNLAVRKQDAPAPGGSALAAEHDPPAAIRVAGCALLNPIALGQLVFVVGE